MQDLETPLLKDLALVFNALGRGLGQALSLAAVGLVLMFARRWLALVAFALVESLTLLSSALLKAAVGRPRPPDGLIHPLSSAFPSGHAGYAGATCVALVLLFTAPGRGRHWWWTLAALGIIGPGAEPISRCTGCQTSSRGRYSESASRCSCSAPPSCGASGGRGSTYEVTAATFLIVT
jgi:hypothetical protein